MEEPSGNGSSVAVEVGVEVAEAEEDKFAEDAMTVGIAVSIGHVGVFVVEFGISEHGPGPDSVKEWCIGNGSSVGVEVGTGVVEDDDPGRVEVDWSGDEDIEKLSVEVFGTKVCVVERLLPAVMGLVCLGSGDEVAGVSKIGAVEQGLLMPWNWDQSLEVIASKPQHMMDTDSSGWTWAQVPQRTAMIARRWRSFMVVQFGIGVCWRLRCREGSGRMRM
jgi:hypothetical protein